MAAAPCALPWACACRNALGCAPSLGLARRLKNFGAYLQALAIAGRGGTLNLGVPDMVPDMVPPLPAVNRYRNPKGYGTLPPFLCDRTPKTGG